MRIFNLGIDPLWIGLAVFAAAFIYDRLRRHSPTARLEEAVARRQPLYPVPDPYESIPVEVEVMPPVPAEVEPGDAQMQTRCTVPQAIAAIKNRSLSLSSTTFRQGAYSCLARALVMRQSPFLTLRHVSVKRETEPNGREHNAFQAMFRKIHSIYALYDELAWILASEMAEAMAAPGAPTYYDRAPDTARAKELIEELTRSMPLLSFPKYWNGMGDRIMPIPAERRIFVGRFPSKKEKLLLQRAHAHARTVLLPHREKFEEMAAILAENGSIDAAEIDEILGHEAAPEAAEATTPLS